MSNREKNGRLPEKQMRFLKKGAVKNKIEAQGVLSSSDNKSPARLVFTSILAPKIAR